MAYRSQKYAKRCGQHWIQRRMQREERLVCTIVTAEDWTTIVRYMLPTQCKAFHKEYEDTRLSLSPSVATHTHTANSCILLTTNRRMMSSWFRWIRSKRVSTSAILLSTPTPANRKYIAARGTACSRTKTTDTIPCNKCCLQWQL